MRILALMLPLETISLGSNVGRVRYRLSRVSVMSQVSILILNSLATVCACLMVCSLVVSFSGSMSPRTRRPPMAFAERAAVTLLSTPPESPRMIPSALVFST